MLRRRTPSYPFRKPRDLYPEILQRILDDEQKLAATRAKLAAEQVAAQQPTDPHPTPAPSHQNQTSQETTLMPMHPPELENEIKTVQSRINELIEGCPPQPDTRPIHEASLNNQNTISDPSPEISTNPAKPRRKRSPARRSAVANNAKQYLRAAPKFLRGRPGLARHTRKCQICRHPDRELIEDLYIHWHSANSILDFINSASDDDADPDQNENNITWVAVYRHAYALGLDEVRRRNLRFAFELLIEQAGEITPTSAAIMAAARAYSCISDDGRWSDPPKHVIVTNQHVHHSAQQAAEGAFVAADFSHRPAPPEFVGADFSHRPAENFSECGLSRAQSSGTSTPLCHTTGQLRDTGSPVAASGVRSGSLAEAPLEKGGQSPASDSTPPLTDHASRDTNHAAVLPASVPPSIPASDSTPPLTGHRSRDTNHAAVLPASVPPCVPASDSTPPLTDHASRDTNHAAVLPASVPPSIPASDSLTQQPSTNCHSERVPAVLAGTTRNLHFGSSSEADAGIRNSAKPLKNREKTFSNR